MDLAIETKGLTKYYGKHLGITGVDLKVEQGEVFGFLGPNGAGKTTMIRLLLDALRPTLGTANVLGFDPWKQRVELHRQIGFLPSELPSVKRISVGDWLQWVARIRNVDAKDRIHELAHRLNLDLTRQANDLSLGNKRKMGLVQALMHEPKLIVLDEPTSGLDPLMQIEFRHLMIEQKNRGATVFLSSHALDEVEHIADRVGIIRKGQLVAHESVEGLREKTLQIIDVRFAQQPQTEELRTIDGVKDVVVDGHTTRFTISGSVDQLIKTIAKYEVSSIRSTGDDLETAFLQFYKESSDES